MAKTTTAPTKITETAPTLEDKLAEIDRRLKQQTLDEKRKVAVAHLAEARNRVKTLLAKTTDHELKSAMDEVKKLERMAGDPPTQDDGIGKRVRRSADDLQADAIKLVEFLRGNPGSRGTAVQEATGVVVKAPLNVRTFVEKYGPKGVKVKVEGQKAGTTYSIK